MFLCTLPQLLYSAAQESVFLLQNVYADNICLQLVLHIQKHTSCTLDCDSEHHVKALYVPLGIMEELNFI